jgi:hypothetical protein
MPRHLTPLLLLSWACATSVAQAQSPQRAEERAQTLSAEKRAPTLSTEERAQKHLVSRIYQATAGSAEVCAQAPAAAAQAFSEARQRFEAHYPGLMQQVTRSPHYEVARAQYRHATLDPKAQTADQLAGQCEFLADTLRAHTDTDKGRETVKRWEKTLSASPAAAPAQ